MLQGAGFVPEETYWVARLVRSIPQSRVDRIVIYRDGPWPKGYWGRCWAKEIESLQREVMRVWFSLYFFAVGFCRFVS